MRRVLVVAGLVLIGLGLALYFSLSRTEVARTLSRGEPVHFLYLLRLFPADPPDLALVASLSPSQGLTLILIPGTLAVPKDGGWSTLSAVYSSEGLAGLKTRISGLLGFSFLKATEMQPADWDKLVEKLGGVVVRPAERLFFQDPDRSLVFDFPAGEQLLFGPKTREYLVYGIRYLGDPRFALVREFFQDLLAWLWARAKEALSVLGTGWEDRDFWRKAWALPEGKVRLELLPLVMENSYLMPDLVKVRKLEELVFFGKTFLTRDEVRIVVLNGTRERFLATRTASWLSARGFQVIGTGTADRSDYVRTYVLVGPGAEEKAALLRDLLPGEITVTTGEAFGVEKLSGWPKGADLILILGAGFDVGP